MSGAMTLGLMTLGSMTLSSTTPGAKRGCDRETAERVESASPARGRGEA